MLMLMMTTSITGLTTRPLHNICIIIAKRHSQLNHNCNTGNGSLRSQANAFCSRPCSSKRSTTPAASLQFASLSFGHDVLVDVPDRSLLVDLA